MTYNENNAKQYNKKQQKNGSNTVHNNKLRILDLEWELYRAIWSFLCTAKSHQIL